MKDVGRCISPSFAAETGIVLATRLPYWVAAKNASKECIATASDDNYSVARDGELQRGNKSDMQSKPTVEVATEAGAAAGTRLKVQRSSDHGRPAGGDEEKEIATAAEEDDDDDEI